MKPWQMLIGVAALAAAGCATTPEEERALAQARVAYQVAQADPHVSRFAPGELALAGQMLAQLQAEASNASSVWVQHRAYLAEQQVHVARHRAMARAAEAELANAKQERERLVARTREVQPKPDVVQAKPDPQVEKLNREVQALRQRLDEQRAQAELRSSMAALQARETQDGWVLTLDNEWLFGSANRTTLRPGAERKLEGLAQVLKQHPAQQVLVQGYADSRAGSPETDRLIAHMRAAAVKDALVKHGVDPKSVAARGVGAADERRVQISIVPGGASAGR